MALVICPDCGREISEYTEMCSNCGFPLQKYLKENNFTNISGVLICPKCAKIYNNSRRRVPQRLKCEYCGTSVIQTSEDCNEMMKLMGKEEPYRQKCIELAKQYGNNQFDQKAFDNRYVTISKKIQEHHDQEKAKSQSAQQQNVPKCPTCGSTNIRKMGTGERAASILGFGILSKKINKTWKCNNCGHTW